MSKDLIEAYLWTTPNGEKISIMLEELAVPYEVHMVDISKNEQFAPEFLKISPNNKIPAIVDHDGPDGRPLAIFESGAILQYLGRKYEAFYPQNERKKAEVDQWLFWQIGGLGPMSGQCYHFRKYAPVKIDYGIERYTKEVTRLYGVMNKRLADRPFLAGDYTIAAGGGWDSEVLSVSDLPGRLTFSAAPVPLPGMGMLFGGAVVAMLGRRRRADSGCPSPSG